MMTLRRTDVSSRLSRPLLPSLSVFHSPPVARGLADEFAARLAADITYGNLAPGTKLPTEQEMIAATGVSRTVVREAVAALRAEGLVMTRQGVGAFVADTARRPFRIEADERDSLREILQVMELRTGIEIEAAGIAAERGSRADVERIAQAFAAIERAMARDDSAVDEDFAFHCRIAEATGNPKFLRFLDYLGRFIIPRQTVNVLADGSGRRAYLKTIQREHRQILDAIRGKSAAPARAAMRRHLHNSRKRYQKLAAKFQQG
jgi:GntR family transcriptional repressor for pyruvate dehydrogenase complex